MWYFLGGFRNNKEDRKWQTNTFFDILTYRIYINKFLIKKNLKRMIYERSDNGRRIEIYKIYNIILVESNHISIWKFLKINIFIFKK